MVRSFARQLVSSLQQRGATDTLSYALGRFAAVRRGYGLGSGLLQKWHGGADGERGEPSIFSRIDLVAAAAALSETALYAGLQLPPDTVVEIVNWAKESKLRPMSKRSQDDSFRYDEVRGGRTPKGDPAVVAAVVKAEQNPLVERISKDAQVIEIVRRHLGYRPPHSNVRLVWSFVTDCSDDERRAAMQTIDYHFDVHHYNFMYANYYLLDTDMYSGAHGMVLGSHRDKPIHWLFRSACQSDAAIRAHYGARRELVIEGRAGYGFIQDASCYHKALAPTQRERLLLQIRYW